MLTEPGRYLVGDVGLLRTEILLISTKSAHQRERWIYLDAGLYKGLDETLNERIILHRRHSYELPVDLTSAISSLFIRGRLHRRPRLGPPRSAINSR